MNAAELIRKLQELPPEAPVLVVVRDITIETIIDLTSVEFPRPVGHVMVIGDVRKVQH